MSAKEIKELRQSGKLMEALEMAQIELDANPENIWCKRNIGWVYYELIKVNANVATYKICINYLTLLKDLNFNSDEKMIFDSVAYQIGKLVFSIQNSDYLDYFKINEIFELIKAFHFTKPSESYTFLYKSFHKGYKNWSNYIVFAEWWGFHNFCTKDYLKDILPNKKEIMPLVEQAYIAYSKKVIEGFENSNDSNFNIEKITSFLTQLDHLITNYPNYEYPLYFKTKLLLVLGNHAQALNSFIPFAKKKITNFWVWELLSDVYSNNDDRKLACLCKALTLKSKEDFIIKTRQKLASICIDKKLYNEAKYELSTILKIRQKHGWKIPKEVTEWVGESWYSNANLKISNKDFYEPFVIKAESLLFENEVEELVLVDFVNNEKQLLNFIKDKKLKGFFSYKNILEKPQIGDLLAVRLTSLGSEGFYKVLTIRKVENKKLAQCTSYKKVNGIVKIQKNKLFGFVDDVFIQSEILKKYNLRNNQQVTCNALLSFDKKKEKWGWKAFAINN